MAVNLYTPSPALNTADSNTGANFRVMVKLASASNGQIRVRFIASSQSAGDGIIINGASIGKWDGLTLSSSSCDMTTPAYRLLFSGASTGTVPYNSTLTSDFVVHTGLTLAANDWLIVCYCTGNPARQLYSTGTTATTVFKPTGIDYSQAQTAVDMGANLLIVGGIQPGSSGGYNFSVDSVDTNDAGGGGGIPTRSFIGYRDFLITDNARNFQASSFYLGTEAGSAAPPTSRAKVWNGSAWVSKPVKVWNGSAWVTKPLKFWNGSAWV